MQRAKNEEKTQIQYMFIAVFIGFFSGGAAHWLTAYGLPINPALNICVTAYTLLFSYALFRHKLLDVNVVIRRGFVYLVLTSIMTSIYLSLILISEFSFRSIIGYKSVLIAIAASTIIAVTFNPLRDKLQRIIDKYFFKIDPDKLIKENLLMKIELRKQDQLKSVATLAAGMAHEIKNPLTTIKTFAEFLPQKYDDPRFREIFKRLIMDEVDRVNNIVQQLLDFSKPKELELKPESIVPILEETLGLLSNNFLKSKIELIKDCSVDIRIAVDKNQLKQAFLNLFLNSIQAMPNGGKLVVRTYDTSDGGLVIIISDTGAGITPENLPHIFDPFFTTHEDGTGLGLSIVHGIITKHGGKIEVKSQLGIGTTISVFLKN